MTRYEEGGYKGLLNCFNYPGLHHFFHLLNFSFFKLVGTNHTCWYLLFSALHGLNCFLLYCLLNSIQTAFQVNPNFKFLPLICASLFLVFPYNLEAVTWKACMHYLLTTGMLLGALKALISFIQEPNRRLLFLANGLFFLSLFSLELSYIFPVMTLFVLALAKWNDTPSTIIKRLTLGALILQLALLVFHLVLNKLYLGEVVGHYGAEQHLVFSLSDIVANTLRYTLKLLVFGHFLPFNLKSILYESTNNSVIQWIVIGMVIGLLFLLWKKGAMKATSAKSNILFFVLFGLALAPIITLYFSWILLFENDRYNYFAAAFFIPALIYTLNHIKYNWLRISSIVLYSSLCLFLFGKMISYAHHAGKFENGLVKNFNFEDYKGDIYILGVPDNYQGLYLYRDYAYQGDFLKKAFHHFEKKSPEANVYDVAQFNAMTPTDGLKITFPERGKIKVKFNQYGNWFWQNGIVLSSYKKENYEVTSGQGFYELKIDKPNADQLFIFSSGSNWNQATWPSEFFK